jgi:hypothetical protein
MPLKKVTNKTMSKETIPHQMKEWMQNRIINTVLMNVQKEVNICIKIKIINSFMKSEEIIIII